MTPTPITVPFPAGVAAVDLAGGQLVAVLLDSPSAPMAELTLEVAADTDDWRPLLLQTASGAFAPLTVPLRAGAYAQLPEVVRLLPDAIRVRVTNVGAEASLILMIQETP